MPDRIDEILADDEFLDGLVGDGDLPDNWEKL